MESVGNDNNTWDWIFFFFLSEQNKTFNYSKPYVPLRPGVLYLTKMYLG